MIPSQAVDGLCGDAQPGREPDEANGRVHSVTPGVALLLDVLEQAPAAIGLLSGPDFRWAYVNPQMVRSASRSSAAEFLGRTIQESLPEVAGQGYFEMLDQVYRTGKRFATNEQKIVLGKEGEASERYVNFVCQPILGADGKTESILIHSVDVTETVFARQAVEKNEERFHLAQAAAQMGVFEWDPIADERRMSPELDEIFGTRPEEIDRAETWLAHVYPEDRALVLSNMISAVDSGELDFSYRYVHPSRGTRWLYTRGRRLSGSSRLFGVVLDVTDRKRSEEGVRQKQEEFEQLADSLPHLVWLADKDGKVYWCNRRWFDYSGLDQKDAENWRVIFDEASFASVLHNWQEAVRKEQPFEMTFRLRGKDGVFRPFLSRALPLRNSEGKVTRWLGTNTEIDAEVRIREELERNEVRLREVMLDLQRVAAVVESTDYAIIGTDTNGCVTSWNPGATALFGYTAEEMTGRSIRCLAPSELQGEVNELFAKLRRGCRTVHHESERLRNDGSRVHVSLNVSPVLDSDGRVVGFSGIARDVSERNLLQQAMIESEKLSATGRMAASIAHEINNPLEAMTNLAFLLSMDPTLSQDSRQHVQLLLNEISRVSGIAKRSLAYFRDSNKPVRFDLCAVVQGVLDLNRPLLLQKQIELRTELTERCTLLGSAAELQQVVTNLIRNAVDAVKEGGIIRVRLRLRGELCRLTVADNGHGVPQAIRTRLFQPFSSTKGSAGNGLGLWVSRGIIERHKGTIRVHSYPHGEHRGTVFSVALPAAEPLA